MNKINVSKMKTICFIFALHFSTNNI